MTEFIRTPDSNFEGLADFPFEPNYHQWHDLRMHYVDVGPKDAPVMLLLHGMPTWGYLYRDVIPPLVAAGYRCIAPDHMGFGRSDKPIDPHWYSIARHTEILTSLLTVLDLTEITLVCQDWGGPIGLAQAATMPERFARLTIMNTWLHHPEFEYSQAIRDWNANWHPGGLYQRDTPDVGLLLVMSAGLMDSAAFRAAFTNEQPAELTGAAADMYRGFAAPVHGLTDAAYNGLRRFPLSIPFDNYVGGNGAAQTYHYRTLRDWSGPAHFIWGITDAVFTEAWGRQWAQQLPQATFDGIPGAGHFLQNTHGAELASILLERIAQE